MTGGAGFIGSAVVRHLIADTSHEVPNLDKLTYAGNLAGVAGDPRYRFEQAYVADTEFAGVEVGEGEVVLVVQSRALGAFSGREAGPSDVRQLAGDSLRRA